MGEATVDRSDYLKSGSHARCVDLTHKMSELPTQINGLVSNMLWCKSVGRRRSVSMFVAEARQIKGGQCVHSRCGVVATPRNEDFGHSPRSCSMLVRQLGMYSFFREGVLLFIHKHLVPHLYPSSYTEGQPILALWLPRVRCLVPRRFRRTAGLRGEPVACQLP